MRILHTADWHVGRAVRGRSRAAEHLAVLHELAVVAEAERADLVLVAGDVFDTAAPSPESERIAYRGLLDLAETGAEVVVVAGNHDHPSRLEAVAPLLEGARIHVGSTVRRPEDGGVIDVAVRTGEVARIALLPFLSQRGVVRADALMDPERDAGRHAQAYDERVRRLVAVLTAGSRTDAVNLVVAHLMVAGGLLGGGERSAHTIFDYAVGAQAFSPALSYVALGHLHRVQRVPGPAPTWYSGSPLQLDFGETADRKAALVVEVTPGRPAVVEERPLTAGRRLRTLRGTLAELAEAVVGDEHLRVVVVGDARAGLAEEVRSRFPDVLEVAVERTDGAGPADPQTDAARLGRAPTELFAEYLEDRGASDQRVAALFAELLDAAEPE